MGETEREAPTSILIVGTGVFGLSTADSLLTNPAYEQTELILIDAYIPAAGAEQDDASGADIEASADALTASLDSSRIIRTDYAKLAYAQLASAAQVHWRSEWPFPTRMDGKDQPVKLYHQVGLICAGCEEAHTNSRGRAYVEASFANVQKLQPSSGGAEALESRDAIRAALRGSDGAPLVNEADDTALGDFGYINRLSGWADASGAMAAMRARVRKRAAERESAGGATLRWMHGTVERLLYDHAADGSGHIVTGARMKNGADVHAAMTIVAAGAWSPALLPRALGTRLHASGQPLSYIPLTEAERKQLAGRPVLLNHGTALFVIPPPPDGAARGPACSMLKAAQHGWGYARSVTVADTEPHDIAGGDDANGEETAAATPGDRMVRVSIPPDTTQPVPTPSARELRAFLANILPEIGRGREFSGTRVCWYADTASGDFLIDFVPRYGRSCLVATGGSGHGFKFLPVLGKYVVQRLEGRLGSAGTEVSTAQASDGAEEPTLPSLDDMVGLHAAPTTDANDEPAELGRTLAHLWRWRTEEELVEDRKSPGDGSRGGAQGLQWQDEMQDGNEDGMLPAKRKHGECEA